MTGDISDGGSIFWASDQTLAQLDEQWVPLRGDDRQSGSERALSVYAVSTTKLEPQIRHEFVVSDLGRPDLRLSAPSPFVDCDSLESIVSAFNAAGGEMEQVEGLSGGTDDGEEISGAAEEARFGPDSSGREEGVLEETGEDVEGRPLPRKPHGG